MSTTRCTRRLQRIGEAGRLGGAREPDEALLDDLEHALDATHLEDGSKRRRELRQLARPLFSRLEVSLLRQRRERTLDDQRRIEAGGAGQASLRLPTLILSADTPRSYSVRLPSGETSRLNLATAAGSARTSSLRPVSSNSSDTTRAFSYTCAMRACLA